MAEADQIQTDTGSPEPYQSLYRRFRPQRFSQVLGQDHVTLALRNAVRDGHVAHAYLFSGPRGTGKTSTARILAKALNCDAPEQGEPCDTCGSCLAIRAGTSFDVHELDAASNNGVEPMRDLVARAALATPGRWKVYIVDEVHMLSAAASNALLKTLEEPPAHVVFVLATTDPQKVLATIRSRTQHFEFHLLADEMLSHLVARVADDAALELPEGAVALATRRARGSARDALSLLDQVAASGVADDDEDTLVTVVGALAERDVARGLGAVDAAIRQGRDPLQLAVELVEHLRAGFLALVTGSAASEGGARTAEIERLGTPACVRAMELVGTAIVSMRDAPEPRVTLEVALIRCLHPEADDSPVAYLERLERLERRVEELGSGAPRDAPAPPVAAAEPHATSAPATARPATRGPVGPTAPLEPSPVPPPSALTESGPAAARLALGAFARRAGEDPRPGPAAGEAGAEPRPAPEPPRRSVPNPQGHELEGRDRAEPATTPSERESAPPTRDDLVAAWGDEILASLRSRPRAVYQAGRFVAVEGNVAVFALPNQAHLEHAEPLRSEVSGALSARFATRVDLRLVTEGEAPAAPELEEADEELVREVRSPDPELPGEQDATRDGATWAAHRLLEAFPGAELENK